MTVGGIAMQPLFEHRLELAGFETRALELEGEGPPLVLLHGFADSADTWRRLLDRFGRQDRAALALDLPGFGAAAPLHDGAPVLPQLEAFAIAAVEYAAAGHGEVVLGGNSLGGCVSLRVAERDDVPLCGIVPIAPAGLDMPRWFDLIERDPLMRTLLAAPVPLPEAVVRTVVGTLYRQLAFARGLALENDVVAAFTNHHRERATIARHLATARRLLPELRDPFQLERVRCPVLLIWGDRDRMVSHSGAERVTAALPDAQYVLLDHCGHCPQIEEADRVAELIGEFARPPRAAAA
jgi:pimeloyl-ACP methyl ester carboxylesterase